MTWTSMRFIAAIIAFASVAAPAAHADRWADIQSSCQGTTLKVSAHLKDINGSWEDACARKSGRGIGFGVTRKADKCINNNGMWGEWYLRNHANCRADRGTSWSDVHETCTGPTSSRVSALLKDIQGSWEAACAIKPADAAIQALGVSGPADKCVKNNGMWGEWSKENVTHCGPSFEPVKKAGCFGPNRQVYSARLIGDLGGEDWTAACRKTSGPGNLGTPSRCAKDAIPTGIWGEWYTNESCETPLAWGGLRDNGCVRDMKDPDADAGGISGEGMHGYSAVLWNAGGDWVEACRQAPVNANLPDGTPINMPYPTACVLADADDALGWVTTAVIGAGTAFIASPTGPYAIAAAGAAIALASKAVETGLFAAIDSNINVWGIFWVEDPACGVPDYGDATRVQTVGANSAQTLSTLAVCPDNATNLDGAVTCTCAASQTQSGSVWGTGVYTTDSSICRAALHVGAITAQGGNVKLRATPGRSAYASSTQNGVTTADWGAWESSFEFE